MKLPHPPVRAALLLVLALPATLLAQSGSPTIIVRNADPGNTVQIGQSILPDQPIVIEVRQAGNPPPDSVTVTLQASSGGSRTLTIPESSPGSGSYLSQPLTLANGAVKTTAGRFLPGSLSKDMRGLGTINGDTVSVSVSGAGTQTFNVYDTDLMQAIGENNQGFDLLAKGQTDTINAINSIVRRGKLKPAVLTKLQNALRYAKFRLAQVNELRTYLATPASQGGPPDPIGQFIAQHRVAAIIRNGPDGDLRDIYIQEGSWATQFRQDRVQANWNGIVKGMALGMYNASLAANPVTALGSPLYTLLSGKNAYGEPATPEEIESAAENFAAGVVLMKATPAIIDKVAEGVAKAPYGMDGASTGGVRPVGMPAEAPRTGSAQIGEIVPESVFRQANPNAQVVNIDTGMVIQQVKTKAHLIQAGKQVSFTPQEAQVLEQLHANPNAGNIFEHVEPTGAHEFGGYTDEAVENMIADEHSMHEPGYHHLLNQSDLNAIANVDPATVKVQPEAPGRYPAPTVNAPAAPAGASINGLSKLQLQRLSEQGFTFQNDAQVSALTPETIKNLPQPLLDLVAHDSHVLNQAQLQAVADAQRAANGGTPIGSPSRATTLPSIPPMPTLPGLPGGAANSGPANSTGQMNVTVGSVIMVDPSGRRWEGDLDAQGHASNVRDMDPPRRGVLYAYNATTHSFVLQNNPAVGQGRSQVNATPPTAGGTVPGGTTTKPGGDYSGLDSFGRLLAADGPSQAAAAPAPTSTGSTWGGSAIMVDPSGRMWEATLDAQRHVKYVNSMDEPKKGVVYQWDAATNKFVLQSGAAATPTHSQVYMPAPPPAPSAAAAQAGTTAPPTPAMAGGAQTGAASGPIQGGKINLPFGEPAGTVGTTQQPASAPAGGKLNLPLGEEPTHPPANGGKKVVNVPFGGDEPTTNVTTGPTIQTVAGSGTPINTGTGIPAGRAPLPGGRQHVTFGPDGKAIITNYDAPVGVVPGATPAAAAPDYSKVPLGTLVPNPYGGYSIVAKPTPDTPAPPVGTGEATSWDATSGQWVLVDTDTGKVHEPLKVYRGGKWVLATVSGPTKPTFTSKPVTAAPLAGSSGTVSVTPNPLMQPGQAQTNPSGLQWTTVDPATGDPVTKAKPPPHSGTITVPDEHTGKMVPYAPSVSSSLTEAKPAPTPRPGSSTPTISFKVPNMAGSPAPAATASVTPHFTAPVTLATPTKTIQPVFSIPTASKAPVLTLPMSGSAALKKTVAVTTPVEGKVTKEPPPIALVPGGN